MECHSIRIRTRIKLNKQYHLHVHVCSQCVIVNVQCARPIDARVQAKRMRFRIRMNHVPDVRTQKRHKKKIETETWIRAQHMESVVFMRNLTRVMDAVAQCTLVVSRVES